MSRKMPGGIVLGFLFVTGCSLDYGKNTLTAEEIPQMVFTDIHQSAVKDGRRLYTMESNSSEVFPTKKEVRLKGFRFQEYDSDGKPVTKGSADSAIINSDSNDARLGGKLMARSDAQAVTLEIEGGPEGSLTWTNEDQVLKTGPNTGVTLSKDDGSKIEARSLTLDMGTNKLQLEDGVVGTWTPEKKDDADSPSPGNPDPSPHP